jgi:hypothetical protein
MSIADILTQQYLKNTSVQNKCTSPIFEQEEMPYEVIQANKVYKVGDVRIEFQSIKDNEIYSFSLSTEEGIKELGTVYKIAQNVWTARAKDIPDFEGTGSDMVLATIECLSQLGEI